MMKSTRLSVMMFLQYAIWGAWSPVLSVYLIDDLGYSGTQVGFIYSLLPLATIISPFVGGQIADRYVATQKIIGVVQFVGGVLLLGLSTVSAYDHLVPLLFVYYLFYAPTFALTNAMAFINLHDSRREFAHIRVWGTVGWVIAGILLAVWRLGMQQGPSGRVGGDMLILAGIFSLGMGVQSFTLPHTPPDRTALTPWAIVDALKLLRNRNFLVFTIISFIMAAEVMFYYVLTAPYLTSPDIGIPVSSVSGVMVLAQISEVVVMARVLPGFLAKFGIRWTLIIGAMVWPVRFLLFAFGPPWLVIASLVLHGVSHVFFFTAAFIFADMVSPGDIRNSAQSLVSITILGLGNYAGSLMAGYVQTVFTDGGGFTNWTPVFLVPCVVTLAASVILAVLFREPSGPVARNSV